MTTYKLNLECNGKTVTLNDEEARILLGTLGITYKINREEVSLSVLNKVTALMREDGLSFSELGGDELLNGI